MINIIIIAVLVAIVGGIGFYLYREKKSGAACIGCPHCKTCAKGRMGGCSCQNDNK